MNGIIHSTGDVVGSRYTLTGYVGQGGMQEVYSAHDALLDRVVALKSPKGPSAQKRFKRSAVVAARVNHANVAKTLDYLEENDRPYLIEELVTGCNLSEFRQNYVGYLDPYSVALLLTYLAKGVQASHHAEVVHRDLKPSNVMVVGGRDFLGAKLTDFGIAKLAEDEIGAAVEGGGEALTASATALGALPYMSPEMIEEPKSASKPTDVWALGAMTYELMTGVKPFGDGYKAVRRIQENDTPQLPANISSHNQFSMLSNEIYAIVAGCLNKDPSARLTADQIVSACGDLCYAQGKRKYGMVKSTFYNAYGYIDVEGEDKPVFFHSSVLYNTPFPTVGQRVWLSSYRGNPANRAFPVVAARAVGDA